MNENAADYTLVTDDEIVEPMDDNQIMNVCWTLVENAQNRSDGDLSIDRQRALAYYEGRPYGNEKKGESKVVTLEVFETIENALPGIIRPFLTGGKIAEYAPQDADDVEAAKQETRAVNSITLQRGDTFKLLSSWLRDILLYPNGYVKIYHNESVSMTYETYEGQTEIQVGMLDSNPDVEIIGLGPNPESTEQIPLFDVDVAIENRTGEIVRESVPPDEVLVAGNTNTIDLDEADAVFHWREITRSELVDMGYDKKMVWGLPTSRTQEYSTEVEHRENTEDEDPAQAQSADDSMVLLDYYEGYLKIDVDQDGIAERKRVCFSGGSSGSATLMHMEDSEYQPFIACATVVRPHRHAGISMAKPAMENQLVTSTVLRQTLNNTYRVIQPRTFAGRGVNRDQLLTYVPNGVVDTPNGTDQVRTEQIPVAIQQILPLFDYLSKKLEDRTGVSKGQAGLDADVIRESTMTAYVNALSQALQRPELVVRTFAEMGVKKLLMKTQYLMRTHQDVHAYMYEQGDFVPVDPTNWRTRKDMVVKIGLGTGTAAEKTSSTMSILEMQKEMLSMGLTTPDRIFNALQDFSESVGRPNADMYFLDPRSQEYQDIQQQQRQQQQQQQRHLQMAIMAQMEDMKAGRMIDMQKLEADIEEMNMKHEQQMTKLELEYDQNVPGSAV